MGPAAPPRRARLAASPAPAVCYADPFDARIHASPAGGALGRGVPGPGRLLLRRPLCTAAPQAGRSALSKAAAAAGVGLGIGCGVLAWRQLAAGDASGSGSASGSAPSSSSTWATQDRAVPRSALTARYEFKKCLGKGGFGDVWLAVEVATGKKVAVK